MHTPGRPCPHTSRAFLATPRRAITAPDPRTHTGTSPMYAPSCDPLPLEAVASVGFDLRSAERASSAHTARPGSRLAAAWGAGNGAALRGLTGTIHTLPARHPNPAPAALVSEMRTDRVVRCVFRNFQSLHRCAAGGGFSSPDPTPLRPRPDVRGNGVASRVSNDDRNSIGVHKEGGIRVPRRRLHTLQALRPT
jgi:hypothetical protein